MTEPLVFSELVARAAEMAAVWHEGQLRRDPGAKVPYIVHPFSVGLLLMRAGLPDDVVAAGLLHDVIEDSGVTRREIAKLFNPHVADLVAEVTEPVNVSDWKKRKSQFLARLAKASDEALSIKCADHIDNLQSILRISAAGHDPWDLFYATREDKVWYETEMFKLVKGKAKPALWRLHALSLAQFEALAQVPA